MSSGEAVRSDIVDRLMGAFKSPYQFNRSIYVSETLGSSISFSRW